MYLHTIKTIQNWVVENERNGEVEKPKKLKKEIFNTFILAYLGANLPLL